MIRGRLRICATIAILALPMAGCTWHGAPTTLQCVGPDATLAVPTVDAAIPCAEEVFVEQPPAVDASEREPWSLSLEDAIQIALANSSVLGDLGGRLIQAPSLTHTIYGPSIQATDPRTGIEAALSEFDAQFAARAFFEKNDRVLNNVLLGGGVNLFRQDLGRIQTELSKKAVAGTQLSVRHNITDDLNNATQNLYPRHQDWNIETEIRQPLLQGGGVLFNRIAGRSTELGAANGVMIARVRSNVSAYEFELALRDFVSNVENAYWDLCFAFYELDVKTQSRDRTFSTVEEERRRHDVAEDEVQQALEQYYRFQQDVENSLDGRLVERTRSFNGSSGGTFQGTGGVSVTERRLRLIMGLPLNDGRLIQPITEPPSAPICLDESEAVVKAIRHRAELQIQRLRIKRQQLQLIADTNHLQPRLDVVGRYRWRGLGDHLYDPYYPGPDAESLSSNRHEWLIGLEFACPVGFRHAHSAVRNSQLRVARERAVLEQMERQVAHDLGNAVVDVRRAHKVMQTAFNRRDAAQKRYELLAPEEDAVRNAKKPEFSAKLDAIRRLAEAETGYFRSRLDHALAIKNLYFEMGSLLDYCNVHLADG